MAAELDETKKRLEAVLRKEKSMDEDSKKTVVEDLRNALYHLADQELVVVLGQHPEEADRLRDCLKLVGRSLDPAQSKIYTVLFQKLSKTQKYNADLRKAGQMGGETRVVLTADELDVLRRTEAPSCMCLWIPRLGDSRSVLPGRGVARHRRAAGPAGRRSRPGGILPESTPSSWAMWENCALRHSGFFRHLPAVGGRGIVPLLRALAKNVDVGGSSDTGQPRPLFCRSWPKVITWAEDDCHGRQPLSV
jgi:hypothetical protein